MNHSPAIRPPIIGAAFVAGSLLAAAPSSVRAHGAGTGAVDHGWAVWNLSPALFAALVLGVWLYVRGVAALWRCAGLGRGVQRWQTVAYGGGMLSLTVALLSPLDALSGERFSAHMAQHVLLTLVAAPLLALGAPPLPFLWAMPQPWRRALARCPRRPIPRMLLRLLTQPAVVWVLAATTLWAWHLPALYEAALGDDLLHAAEHATLLGTAFLFWWALVPHLGPRRLGHGAGIAFLFAAAMQGMALCLFMALATTPWYGVYRLAASSQGIDAVRDQQVAAWVMWTPMSVIYLVAALALFIAWLRLAEERTARTQRTGPPVIAA